MPQQEPPAPPPLPPLPPGTTVSGTLEGWDAVALLLGGAILLVMVLWPIIRAIARRIEAGAGAAEARAELEGLRERVRLLEDSLPRLGELEERMDFAERLLAGQRETDRLHH